MSSALLEPTRRLSKREKRIMRQQGLLEDTGGKFPVKFSMKDLRPLTDNQRLTFEAWDAGENLLLHGTAGTGKSFISMGLALEELIEGKTSAEKLVIIRSAVPTRDIGFMPGNAKEKTRLYESPYIAICAELFGRADAYEILKTKDVVNFETTSFIRGLTLNNCIVMVDEIANLTYHELDSVITRIGKNCRVVFCGDFKQSDFTKDQDKSGLPLFMKVLKKMRSFTSIEFDHNDIVRSALVREYILAKENLGITA